MSINNKIYRYKYVYFVLTQQLTKRVFYDSEKMTLLKDELKEVTEEQAALDMKEEFPKYARLGRKKTKIQDQLKSFRKCSFIANCSL